MNSVTSAEVKCGLYFEDSTHLLPGRNAIKSQEGSFKVPCGHLPNLIQSIFKWHIICTWKRKYICMCEGVWTYLCVAILLLPLVVLAAIYRVDKNSTGSPDKSIPKFAIITQAYFHNLCQSNGKAGARLGLLLEKILRWVYGNTNRIWSIFSQICIVLFSSRCYTPRPARVCFY